MKNYGILIKKNVYVTQGIWPFIFSRCILNVELIDDQPSTKITKNRLINSVCFQVRSIEGYKEIKEWKHIVESAVHGTWKWYEN